MIQNPWDAAKAVLRWIDTSFPQELRQLSNNLTLYPKELEKGQNIPKLVEGKKSYRSEQNK